MPYAYVDELTMADLAFRAWGATLEETFIAAAEATTNAMVEDLRTIAPQEERVFALHDEQLDLLLLQFLQEFVYYKDAQQLLLRPQQVSIQRHADHFALQALAVGETINAAKHALGDDVKGVTLHHLQVIATHTGWEATVILDV